jgi:hypothetical protein
MKVYVYSFEGPCLTRRRVMVFAESDEEAERLFKSHNEDAEKLLTNKAYAENLGFSVRKYVVERGRVLNF